MTGDEKTLYVADSLGGAIHIVDVSGHKVTGSISLDRTPLGVVIDDSPARRTGVGRVLNHLLRTRLPAFAAATDSGLVPEEPNLR
jgi:YVTN family beta-propeller protein